MPYDSHAIDELLAAALDRIRAARRLPESTYRLQLHAGFTFRDAAAIVPYLAKLGVTHVYASPYLKAKPGSMHGYDVIDHCRLNPELGGVEGFNTFVAALNEYGMSHIADMVPNHVGVATNENNWWNDVLKNGPDSPYAKFFDINFNGSPQSNLSGRVLIPILGSMYGEELEKGNLKLKQENGEYFVDYHERKFPISPKTYSLISGDLESFNGKSGDPKSFDRLDDLLRRQHFRLASWKTAPDEINYRRFFDVNDLAALSMERLEVFRQTHELTLTLLAQNKIAGLRVDHPDGLYDPAAYLVRLQKYYLLAVIRETLKESKRFDEKSWHEIEPLILQKLDKEIPIAGEGALRWPLYVLGEKILALDEPLCKSWATAGTSGYEFLNMTNGLFVNSNAADQFSEIYHDWTGDADKYADIVYRKKKLILEISMASELHMLASELKEIAQKDRYGIDFSLHGLLVALKEVIACFPVYRSYITEGPVAETDRRQIERAVDAGIQRNPHTDEAVFRFIQTKLLEGPRHFAGKFQQLTSPVTAKGIEDTTFYIYNRLLSLNEVGGDPSRFGIAPSQLHECFQNRQRDWPYAMSTLSTHDTKRSEDVRARINVLSEMPQLWREHLQRWENLNEPHRTKIGDTFAPHRNDEYMLYQSLLGAWPLDESDFKSFHERMHAFMLKAMREAKVRTSWTDPNTEYETAVRKFMDAILTGPQAAEFREDFLSLQKFVSHLGTLNSLSQTLIKLTAPGVPDTYQGCELWDFSLVDPDNRRPVDFPQRQRLLRELPEQAKICELLNSPQDGRVKMQLDRIVLQCRARNRGLFTNGAYVPLQVSGKQSEHVFAFARVYENRKAITVVPRLVFALTGESTAWPVGQKIWDDTSIQLPPEFQGAYRNLLTDMHSNLTSNPAMKDIFADCPLALFVSE